MSLRNAARKLLLSRSRIFSAGNTRTPQQQPRRSVGAYENDGKTYVSMLNNNNIREGIMISGYSQYGFRLNNGFTVLGPVVCFANSIMAWRVENDRDVNVDSLSMLFHLEPAPSVIVLGLGDSTQRNRRDDNHRKLQLHRQQFDKVVWAAARQYGCTVEILPVDAALATYNFIISEGRNAVGAFIPPRFIPAMDDDAITANARHIHLYGESVPVTDVWEDADERSELINANYREFGEVVGAQKAAEHERRAKLARDRKPGEEPEKKIR
ncbi:NADH dehydrogenase [ubiquinone] 1 alpha subcomplex assembly factor 3 [Melanaphis sacchari]|uniref:NADH dehydrogenase [ubiquinone] 1 alpha subcomplex assembly factor 3 n=1 Tax=Melanaphis sacchari TaxID=742174 RepID=UPI000DC13FEE|nr:NADH dehydrogenase [ubiquinone] 1 alpha subcomplex assembly factor 3 [Melanaphis sacchari]